jgi:hypothetical protein
MIAHADSSQHPLHRAERFAKLMDEAFTIPGTRFKVGLDAIIGLIPGIGDLAGLVMGSWLIYEAHRIGTPAHIKWKMARNVVIDAFAGLVPVVGDAVDFVFKSNRLNLALMRGHFQVDAPASRRLSPWLRLLFTVMIGGAGWWLWQHFHGG